MMPTIGATMDSVRSADGTTVAFERRGSGPANRPLEAVAHTLVYDCMIAGATSFELVTTVTTTLVLDSLGSSGDPRGTR